MLHFFYRPGNHYIFVHVEINYLSIAGRNFDENYNFVRHFGRTLWFWFWMDEKLHFRWHACVSLLCFMLTNRYRQTSFWLFLCLCPPVVARSIMSESCFCFATSVGRFSLNFHNWCILEQSSNMSKIYHFGVFFSYIFGVHWCIVCKLLLAVHIGANVNWCWGSGGQEGVGGQKVNADQDPIRRSRTQLDVLAV